MELCLVVLLFAITLAIWSEKTINIHITHKHVVDEPKGVPIEHKEDDEALSEKDFPQVMQDIWGLVNEDEQ